MLLNLLLVVHTSILPISTRAINPNESLLSERARRIIQNEISLRSERQAKRQANEELYALNDSYFMDPMGDWVDSAYDYYWDEKWVHFNCYSYAIQRYDILPSYYPPYTYDPDEDSRSYVPGQISSFEDAGQEISAREQAEAIVMDFGVLGYRDVSAFRFEGTLPALAADEELIAVRTSEPPGDYDFHLMRYDKTNGCWHHKVGPRHILKYKYPLSERLAWTNEYPFTRFDVRKTLLYSSDIWLVRYTPIIIRPSMGTMLHETIYIDNIGDKVVTLDVAASGHLDLGFYNVNGFTAILYTDEWDAVAAANYGPIAVDVPAGRYYLVMKNYRYSDNVYVTVSLSDVQGNATPTVSGDMFAISEDDGLIVGKVIDETSADVTFVPATFYSEDNRCGLEVRK